MPTPYSVASVQRCWNSLRSQGTQRLAGTTNVKPRPALRIKSLRKWLGRTTPPGVNDNPSPPGVTKFPGPVYRYTGSFERGRVEYIGPEAGHILGYSAAEIQAMPVENMLLPWLSPHASHGADYVEYLKQVFAPGKPMSAINRATTKSGEIRWILLSAQPVADHGDGTFSLDGVIVDVTDQVESGVLGAQDLARTQEPEENPLMRAMRTLIHDVANILAATRMFADLVVSETESDSKAHQYAGRIVKACDGGAEKIKQAAAQLRIEEQKAAGEDRP